MSITFKSDAPPSQLDNGAFVIKNDEDLQRFLSELEKNKQYSTIYLDPTMANEMEKVFRYDNRYKGSELERAFQAFQKGPSVGAGVGFVHQGQGVESLVLNVSESLAVVQPHAPTQDIVDDLDELMQPTQALRDDLESSYDDDEDNRPNDAGEGDDEEDILRQSPTFIRGQNLPTQEAPSREFGEIKRMSDEAKEVYKQVFSDDPFNALAELIEQADRELKEKSGSKNVVFRQHLQNIFPVVLLAMGGAREEWREAKENGAPNQAELYQRMQAMEAVFKMVQSMEIMTANRSQFSREYYEQKMDSIIDKIGLPAGKTLADALDRVVSRNVIHSDNASYNYRKHGLTAFDPDKPSQTLHGASRGLKIEHKRSEQEGSNSVVLTGKFDYSRKDVIGVQTGRFTGVKKIFAQRQDNLKEMKSQVAEFVNFALNDFNKGSSKENAIYLQPSNSNQSELQLAILIEFKKRAYLEGRTLFASDDHGNRIEITPSLKFSDEEKQYFAHYAMQVPKVRVGAIEHKESEHCAAYNLYKDVKVDGKPLKDHQIDGIPLKDLNKDGSRKGQIVKANETAEEKTLREAKNQQRAEKMTKVMMKAVKNGFSETVNFSIGKQKDLTQNAAKQIAERNLGATMRL